MILWWMSVWVGTAALYAATCLPTVAQDTQQVAEPKIPESCVQLPAQLRATNHMLNAADEGKLDTQRIQAALNTCKPGMAVELKPASGTMLLAVTENLFPW